MDTPSRLRSLHDRYRFVILLGGLTLLLLAIPLAVTETWWSAQVDRFLILGTFSVMLLSAAFAVSTSRRQTIILTVLTVPTLATSLADAPIAGPDLAIARNILGLTMIGYVIIMLIKHLFTTRTVTIDTIAASLCAYLLLGVLWSIAYTLEDILQPGSFHFANADEAPGGIHFGGERSIYALYYSFVTMTTLGFGDITPTTAAARMLSAVQAVVGQIYLAVLVARLVGMHISQVPARQSEDRAD
jgi:hypothetical protein